MSKLRQKTFSVKYVQKRQEDECYESGEFGHAQDVSLQDQGCCFKEASTEEDHFNADLDDLEDLADVLTPLNRFKKNRKISVTDFSAQLWCEKQLEFSLITGYKRMTPSMVSGVARHEMLEFEDHDVVEVEVATREDALGLRLLNSITLVDQLMSCGKARELWIFGIWNGIVVRGVIDQIEFVNEMGEPDAVNGGQLLISDTKTRSTNTEPSDAQKRTSALQLEMYWLMVNNLRSRCVNFNTLLECYNCDGTCPFQAKELSPYSCLNTLLVDFSQAFSRLPQLWPEVKIDYEFNGTIFACSRLPYKPSSTQYIIHNLLEWWQGYRESERVLVSEKWKCRRCDFLEMCSLCPLGKDEVERILKERPSEEKEEMSKMLNNAQARSTQFLPSSTSHNIKEQNNEVSGSAMTTQPEREFFLASFNLDNSDSKKTKPSGKRQEDPCLSEASKVQVASGARTSPALESFRTSQKKTPSLISSQCIESKRYRTY